MFPLDGSALQTEGQFQTIRFEKILYYYCALKDLQAKSSSETTTTFAVCDFDSLLLKSVASTLASKVVAEDSSEVPKLCFAALTREFNRRHEYVSTLLSQVCEDFGRN